MTTRVDLLVVIFKNWLSFDNQFRYIVSTACWSPGKREGTVLELKAGGDTICLSFLMSAVVLHNSNGTEVLQNRLAKQGGATKPFPFG